MWRFPVVVILWCVLMKPGSADNSCPDRLVLNSVDVRVQRTPYNRTEKYEARNFHALDQYMTVDVTKANVEVLCEGMIKNFPKLQRLSLINVNLTHIRPGAFEAVPKLTQLGLSVNGLTSLSRDQFRNLPALQVLYLSSNKIDQIDPDTFDDLINLRKIHLDRNSLFEINGAWFLRQPKIQLIDLSYNRISKVQTEAFTLPPQAMVDIRLQRNIIEVVEARVAVAGPGTVQGTEPYLTLHLEKNNLRSISADFVQSMSAIMSNLIINSNYIECVSDDILNAVKTSSVSLHLHQNPLSCDCLEKIDKVIKSVEDMKGTFYYSSTLECDAPRWQAPPPSYYDRK